MQVFTQTELSDLLESFRKVGGWVNTRVFGLRNWGPMGAGAVALDDVQPHTPLFHVPNSLVLSPYSSDLHSQLSPEEWDSLTGWSQLILVMMWESSKGENSPWDYYLTRCPIEFDTPMFWTQDQLEELIGTDIEDRVGRHSADTEYNDKVVPVLQAHPELFIPSSPFFSLSAYHMQGSRILSRSFTIPSTKASALNPLAAAPRVVSEEEDDSEDGEDDPGMVVMIPIADMLNAQYERNNAQLIVDDDEPAPTNQGELPSSLPEGFTMVSTTEIRRDEQIINTYSSPPNSELLRKYGHVDILPLDDDQLELLDSAEIGNWPYGNPGDEVGLDGKLVLEAVKRVRSQNGAGLEDNEYARRIDQWLEEGYDDTFYLSLSDSLDTQLIAFIRILTNDGEWQKFETKGRVPRPAVDGTVHAVMDLAIDSRLSKYRHDLASDLAYLTSKPSHDNHHGRATIVRVGEKRILHLARRLSAQAAEVVEGSAKRKGGSDGEESGRKRRA